LSARPRKHRRQRPNLRRKARGLPQMLQRLRCWVENLGFLFVLAIFAVVAIFSFCRACRPSALGYWPLAFSSHSSIPNCSSTSSSAVINSLSQRISSHLSRSSQELMAKSQEPLLLLPKRHSKMLEQRPCLIVVPRRGHNRYVHTLQLVHLRVIDFRENQLVAQTQRVIAATIK
jgi:hypothetical protein